MKTLSILFALALLAPSVGAEPVRNGFDLSGASVPAEQILAGGPPRDGIPALDHPTHMAAATSAWRDEEIVLGVARDGEARAYPVAILNWHELVNDTLGGDPILVSFCPLCGTGLAFDRRIGGKTRTFGVSGLLFRSDLLMFDRESESLWSQISAEALSGPQRGERLRLVRARMMEWGAWKRAHPDTTILSPETGHRRDYGRSPYQGYATSDETYFPVKLDPRYHPKMPTLGLRIAGRAARAYPASELVQAGGSVSERFLGHRVRVGYDGDRQVFEVEAPAEIEVIEGFWFAWAAFHPSATVFRAPADD
ncbi:MAG: DUF3179 domain-containing protein [Myxococcales bacterium]|nr:DUF3179 domain-containing protein [Myxococcales bacterium]